MMIYYPMSKSDYEHLKLALGDNFLCKDCNRIRNDLENHKCQRK